MEFFSTGGFHQLYNDLHQQTCDEFIMPTTTVTNHKNYNTNGIQSDEIIYQDIENDLLTTSKDIYCYADVNFCSIIPTQGNSDYYDNNENNNQYTHNNNNSLDISQNLLTIENFDCQTQIQTQTQTQMQSLLFENEQLTFSTQEISEWENRFLDNFIEIPELVELLPEKTPLCTDMCDYFLQESTEQLKLSPTRNISLTPPPTPTPTPTTPKTESIPTSVTTSKELKTDDDGAVVSQMHYMSQLQRDEKGYQCTFQNCQKIYAKPAHLKAHLRRHLGEKPYVCNWPNCIWKFSRSDELARHRRSHSGVKPYKCDYCAKCFARSDHLTKHRKVHERRLLAASRAGKVIGGVLPHSVYTVRPGRKRKNQIC